MPAGASAEKSGRCLWVSGSVDYSESRCCRLAIRLNGNFLKHGVPDRLSKFVLRDSRCRRPHNNRQQHRALPVGRPRWTLGRCAFWGASHFTPNCSRSVGPPDWGVMRWRRFFDGPGLRFSAETARQFWKVCFVSWPSRLTSFSFGQVAWKCQAHQPKEAVRGVGHFRFSRELKPKCPVECLNLAGASAEKSGCCLWVSGSVDYSEGRCCRLAIRRIGNYLKLGCLIGWAWLFFGAVVGVVLVTSWQQHRAVRFARALDPQSLRIFGVLRTLPQNAPLNRCCCAGALCLDVADKWEPSILQQE